MVKFDNPEHKLLIDLMYRTSEFTRCPRGRLNILPMEARNTKFKKEEYLPRIEMKIGSHREKAEEAIDKVTEKKILKMNWQR